jgi:murein DD-endopeptidase MepM/ murein hydrolase activator NlpD
LRTSPDNPHIGEFGKVRDGGTKNHQGLDLDADEDSRALAADEGEVTFVGERSGYGNIIEIGHRNADGDLVSWTAYAHLANCTVRKGDKVVAGQDLGQTGRTGNAANTPIHLHFEIRTQSMPGHGLDGRLNPLPYFPQLTENH